jgi:hypothetical protein
VAPEEPEALIERLHAAAARIGDGDASAASEGADLVQKPPFDARSRNARMLGVVVGVCIVALAALGAVIAIAARQSPP